MSTRIIYDYKRAIVGSSNLYFFFLVSFSFFLSLLMLTNSVAYCDPTLGKKLIYLVEEVDLTTIAKELKLHKLIGRPVLRSTFHPLNTDGLWTFARYPLAKNIYLGEHTLVGVQQAQYLNTTCYINWKELILLKDMTSEYDPMLYDSKLKEFLKSDMAYKNYIDLSDPASLKNNLCKKK